MTHNIHGTFISEKINKIRWKPNPFDDSNSFITGSWDNDKNNIKLWNFQAGSDDADIYPYTICSYPFEGDVTECQFLSSDNFVASSSNGSVYLLKVHVDERGCISMYDEIMWDKLHKFKNGDISPCTSFAVYDNDIVSIGEDGCIHLLTALKRNIVRTIDEADSCSLKAVIFLKYNEILTGNLRGQMKIWDLRSKENLPSSMFMLSGDQVTVTCLAYHPTQRHMVVAGDEEGSLTVWDLRQNTYPVNLLSAHAECVSELQFHPVYSDQLFSCSSAGELWHWTVNKQNKLLLDEDNVDQNLWIMGDSIKNKLEVYTLMPTLHKPINSLDLNRNRVLCGCDSEAIYLINNVNIYN
ncbi:hypothetical protein Trydic_g6087 [Trypoxylus dichotomus]